MKKLSAFLAIISLAVILIYSCQKDKSDTTYPGGNSNTLRTTVTGIVLDESNAPLNGVTVIAYGQTTTTNQYGTFVLKNLNANKDRCVLQFTKAGFFNRVHGLIASENTVNYVRIVLVSNAPAQNFSASVGGTISLPDGSSAEFQPNSIVTAAGSAYTGTVYLIVKHLSPDDANFGFSFPGGDLAAVNANNENVVLYTYGMLGVELTGSSGEALQLAGGTSATLTMAIAASQLSSAPATIPLWYFDETTSLWKEEGAANKVGSNYVGTVAHFSWWNYDYQGPRAYMKGRVLDCFGVPIPNINVTVNGWCIMTTDQNGEFYDAFPCGMTFTVQILASNNIGIVTNSPVVNVPVLTANQVYTIPDFVVDCITRVMGTIKTCSGELSAGFVHVSNSSFYNYQYTSNGSFSVPALNNVQAVLLAANASFSTSQNITTLTAPNNLNIGNLLLCDTTNVSTNGFVLNGGGFSNQAFNINLTSSSAMVSDSNGTSLTIVNMAGTAPPGFNINGHHIQINDTVPGATTCYVNIFMTNTPNSYVIYGSNLTCNLIQVGSVGNKVKGEYSGVATIQINGIPSTGNISGSFDVVRTQ